MRKKWPEGGCRTPPSPFVNETSLWLLERGLCDPETAAEYVGRKLLSPEAFAQARKEYQRATANYAPAHHAGFTLRKPNECALLEIWHIGYGPNITYGLCVADSNPFWTDPADRQPLIVRYGFPPGELTELPGACAPQR